MTENSLATRIPAQLPEAVEQALVQGDLQRLDPEQRVRLYMELCASLGLNHLSVPFQYIVYNNQLKLYALKSCTDQLRFIHSVNVEIVSRERLDDIYVVTTKATLPNGRTDEEIGAVPIANLKGEALANALMKASTKAKRRVTLAIVGLSLLDETEIESIRDARQPRFQMVVDKATGEIAELPAPVEPPAPAPARSYDGETMKPAAPDPLGADRVARERLTKAFTKLLEDSARVGYPVQELDLAELSNQELAGAINELTKRLADFKREKVSDIPEGAVS